MRPLREVIAHLGDYPPEDEYEVGPTIYARRPWSADSPAVILSEDPVGGTAPGEPDLHYLLEVSIALEVLMVWSRWRKGASPSTDEALEAVLHYATHDAYLPVE